MAEYSGKPNRVVFDDTLEKIYKRLYSNTVQMSWYITIFGKLFLLLKVEFLDFIFSDSNLREYLIASVLNMHKYTFGPIYMKCCVYENDLLIVNSTGKALQTDAGSHTSSFLDTSSKFSTKSVVKS